MALFDVYFLPLKQKAAYGQTLILRAAALVQLQIGSAPDADLSGIFTFH